MIFRSRKKQITKQVNFRIRGQKINTCSNIKHFGIKLEENLEWNLHLSLLKSKLNRTNGSLCKIRYYVPKFVLKTLYYTIFHCYLIYACQICAPKFQPLEENTTTQHKALRFINFKANNYDVRLLYKMIKYSKF